MLRSRIIPVLLIQNGGLVKTHKFGKPKYVGDPLNAVRIFNEKEVDELMIVDIDASRLGLSPNEGMIAKLARESRMPICYAGGVKTVDQIQRIIGLGVEKVAISSGAVDDPKLITRAVTCVGGQSVVGVIDAKYTGVFQRPEVVTLNATRRSGIDPVSFAKRLEALGVGEIVLNSVDNDGLMRGYDSDLIKKIWDTLNIPITVIGGAGSIEHIRALVSQFPLIGAGAGSLFVFKGKYRAVLINYPSRAERDSLNV